jgi:signal transduction histidine kinase
VTRRLWRGRLGLRARVAVLFGLGALLVSLVQAVATVAIASGYLVTQRESSTLRQATFNARDVQDVLLTRRPAIPDLLERIGALSGPSSSPLVLHDGRWYDDLYPPGAGRLPGSFVRALLAGTAVRQRIATPAGPVLAVGIPLPQTDGSAYVEVFSLVELDRTLRTLAYTLAGTGTVTMLTGLVLGAWASRRALRPLAAVNAAAAAIAAGDLHARLGAGRDPDLRGLAESFNDTARALQARVERDGRFAANVSHELRTPLTTMVNAIEVMRSRRERLDPSSREALDLLSEDVQRFARMVEDLLEISRVDTGHARLDLELVRVADLVALAADQSAGRPVTEVRPGGEALMSRLDKRRLERVIVNLVENAQGHGRGVHRVVVEPAAGGVRIAVEDHGPGVPPHHRELIFERFARAPGGPGSPDTGGVGLGLSLVVEHVRLHGGQVRIEDADGGGARFVVDLPVASS